MLLWVMFAALTALVLVIVLRPVVRAAPDPIPADTVQADTVLADTVLADNPDLEVYTAQLADLDRQLADGRMDAAEHAALHHEVARRILRVAQTASLSPASLAPATANPSSLVTAVAALVPIASLGLYLALGRPGVPGHPFRATIGAPADASVGDLIAKVEARLAAAPGNGAGWDMIAPIYFRLQRFADAADAYSRAGALLGETPARLAGFAEATVLAHDGIVTDEARAAYEKLAAATPERFEPRFWLALAKEQDGQRAAAAADYRAMLASAPADASWRPLVEQRLAAVTTAQTLAQTPAQLPDQLPAPMPAQPPKGDRPKTSSPSERGPTARDVAAAAALSDTQRTTMIADMVANLAARLKSDGRDGAGWLKLIRAYVILQQPDKARAALTEARAALVGDGPALMALDDGARSLGLTP